MRCIDYVGDFIVAIVEPYTDQFLCVLSRNHMKDNIKTIKDNPKYSYSVYCLNIILGAMD